MAIIGEKLDPLVLMLTVGRDFSWSFEHIDTSGQPIPFPAGTLFFEFDTKPAKTQWSFVISGAIANLKVESELADLIPARTRWQLVFLPQGETAGGYPIALGLVQRQG
ncbi:DUF7264 domain-containing protein [Nocardia vulneris]|uniref:LtfC/p132/Gp6 beta-sandwich domain-containing protein n=1 Tax=Nocardia vulneris TaxID=1141657 RepID=A0ABR4Z2S9_9NOCA|nr:hypothetical protein [Nocardia vulneris]KIA59631.1 hypothetical protein FG87_41835 [Nocardia vulneris]